MMPEIKSPSKKLSFINDRQGIDSLGSIDAFKDPVD